MPSPSKILILGATGRLGGALVRFSKDGREVISLGHADLDLLKPDEIEAKLDGLDFDVAINAAGVTQVDYCEDHPDEAELVNAYGPQQIAKACQKKGARFVHVSSDYVFNGENRDLLREDDLPAPVNLYGKTKLQGENLVLAACPDALVIRVSWLFGIDRPSFPDRVISQALKQDSVSAIADKWSSPTSAADLASWIMRLVDGSKARGILHLCNEGWCSWQEYGQYALDYVATLGLPLQARQVEAQSMVGFSDFKAARPPFTAFDTSRFQEITGLKPRTWQAALEEYLTAKVAMGAWNSGT